MKVQHAILFALLSAGCNKTEPDTTAPTVVLTSPAADAIGVSLNQGVAASFSEPVDPASFEGYRFVLVIDDEIVPGSITVAGGSALFTPDADFVPYTTYTATIDAIADLAGNTLADPHAWTFTTGANPDVTAPTLSAGTPTGDGVGLDTMVTAAFSEAVDPTTAGGVTLRDDTSGVVCDLTVAGNLVTLTPDDPLEPETVYTVDVASSVTDLAGLSLATSASWTFTTQDVVGPAVTAVVPADGSKGVSVDVALEVQLGEAIDPTSVAGQVTLDDAGGTAVSGVTAVGGSALTFTPAGPLAEDTAYTASVAVGVTDVYGNPLQAAHTWQFRTDVPFIEVLSVTPADSAVNAPLGSSVVIVFDDVIDPASVLPSNVSLTGAAPVGATLEATGSIVVLTPTSPLSADQSYTLSVGAGGVTDHNGHGLALAHESSFSTTDGIGPEVVTVQPADGTRDLPSDLSLQVLFTETIAAGSVAGQVTLEGPGATVVTGSTVAHGSVLRFTPDAPLAADTLYTASVGTGITDPHGNALQAGHSWQFHTDLPYIEVQLVTPADGAEDVALDAALTVVFTDVIDPATVLPANMYLEGTAPVPATLHSAGSTVTLTPSAPLAAYEVHTLVVGTGMTDLNGNGLELAFESSFTTAKLVCTPADVAACDANATCTIVGGDPVCTCNDGYQGTGAVCFDLDECALGTHECDENASCRDTEGSYECTCDEYYEGDGTLCYAIDPEFFIADVSHRPVLIEVPGVGSARIDGLGQIASVVEFETSPVNETTVYHSLIDHHVPDVTMTGVHGLTAADDDALAIWTTEGPTTSVSVHLEGPDGERLVTELALADVEYASINYDRCDDSCASSGDSTCDDGLSGSDNSTCDAGTDCTDCGARSAGMDELVLSVNQLGHSYTAATPTQVPGFSTRLEAEGVATITFLPEDIVETAAGGVTPNFLSKLTYREGEDSPVLVLDWMESNLQELTVQGYVVRKNLSQIHLDSDAQEYERVNCFQVFPSKVWYFNPAKRYGTAPLIDTEIQVEWCEQG